MFNSARRDAVAKATKFYGIYRGTVVNNMDPDTERKVQVRIMPMFEKVQDEQLPWAHYADAFMGAFGNTGGCFIPQVGAGVWCFFEGGDHRYPVFFAGAPSKKDSITNSKTNYPNRKIYSSNTGIELMIDDTDGSATLKVSMPNGYSKQVDNDGNVVETIPGNLTLDVSGNVNITASGGTGMTLNNDLIVNGDINSTGTITADTDVVVGTVTLITHTHVVTTAPGVTGPPVG